MKREQLLLKMAYQLLKKQEDSYYVLNLLEQEVVWDGTYCDGGCLMEEIYELLNDSGIDPDEKELLESEE